MSIERRYAAFEFRAVDGGPGVLTGVAMPYGREAVLPGGLRERFEPGVFGPDVGSLDVLANWQHAREAPLGRTGGGGLELLDGPQELRATLTLPDTAAGRDVATLASQRVLRGFSIEFHALHDRVAAGVRIVERARLSGLAIVDRPAYRDALATLRARIEGAAAPPKRRIWL